VKYDVVIAGGGPAGSMTALVLSRAGKKVLVLDRDLFPRTKVCGYAINPRCWSVWERHGLTGEFLRLPHFELGGFTLEHEGVPVLRHRFRDDRARTVDRAALDLWLAEEAQRSGADYQFGVAVQGLTPSGVQTSRGEIAAALIVGADGRNSVVGRLSGLARPSRHCHRVAWQSYIEASSLGDHVHMNIFPEGYYGLNRIDSTRTTVTIVLSTDSGVKPGEILARYLPEASVSSWKSVSPISRAPWEVTDGRCWLVGDSAQVLEPLTGEGIYSALATAEMAARNILDLERTGVASAVRHYRREHRRFYGRRTLINSCARWMLEDYRRCQPIVNGLKLWPTAVAQMVEWVQAPESLSAKPQMQAG